jgi:predicted NBD/HSP70 family sugar kinase
MNENNQTVAKLTDLPTPQLSDEQLQEFTPESIHAKFAAEFDVKQTSAALDKLEGQRVLGADFGGDKGTSQLFQVQAGKLIPIDGYRDEVQGDDGAGYVASLKKTAAYAEQHNLPFGISWGGPMEDATLLYHPKAKTFIKELSDEFAGNLKNISPKITSAINDAPAGLIAGAVEAYHQFQADSVIFIINGGGIGCSYLKDKTIFATEAGHARGIDQFNTYNQIDECGVFDQTFVCVERLGANKAGIEAQWELLQGERLSARLIEDKYKEGNALAAELYEHSALVIAHTIQGVADVTTIDLANSRSAIVCHGGGFKFPNYGTRVQQILESYNDAPVQLIMTNDFSDPRSNACLDGAAIAALVAKQ